MFGSNKNYYCLVAGLREYTLDADKKGFDAHDIIEEIKEGVSKHDRKTIELFYGYYDISNIVNVRAGREQFSGLGNFTREELEEELASPSRLPGWMAKIVTAYKDAAREDFSEEDIPEGVDMNSPLERSLFAEYYRQCAKSDSRFLREWAAFDSTLRNLSAAFAARRRGVPPGEYLVGDNDIVSALARSSSADFGLKGEVSYIDQVITAISETDNLVEKENRMDMIRWGMADELTSQSYFDVSYLLGYLVKVNIIHRWATLDPEYGRQMLRKLIDSLTGKEFITEAYAAE